MNKAVFAIVAALLAVSDPARAAELTLTFRDGTVTLDARDVTVGQILAEWARIGQTKIVNIERVATPTVTLRLDGTPEKQALEIILRALPGYLAAARPTPLSGASSYDRIVLLTSTSVAAPSRQPVPGPTALQQRPPMPLRQSFPVLNPGELPDADAEPVYEELDEEPEDGDERAPVPGTQPVTGQPVMPGLFGQPPPGPLQPPAGAGDPPGDSLSRPPLPNNPWNAPAGAATPGPPSPVQQPAPGGANQPEPLPPPDPDPGL
jgi:hypothetical protein